MEERRGTNLPYITSWSVSLREDQYRSLLSVLFLRKRESRILDGTKDGVL